MLRTSAIRAGVVVLASVVVAKADTTSLRFVGTTAAFLSSALTGMVATPDGRHIYVGDAFYLPGPALTGIKVLSRDASSGSLTFAGLVTEFDASALAVGPDPSSPAGGFIFAGASDTGSLFSYTRNAATGALAQVDVEGGFVPSALGVSPDGTHLYAAQVGGGVRIFAIGSGGDLTLLETDDYVFGIGSSLTIVVSSDGTTVYVTDPQPHALVVFARNATTGSLTHVQTLANGQAGVENMDFPVGLALSPDGEHLYVTAFATESLVVLDRDTGTGALTFVESHRGFVRTGGGVAVSADGQTVWATTNDVSSGSGAVSSWWRDAATGRLTTTQVHVDGEAGADGLDGARWVVASADDRHAYVLSASPDYTVAVFAVESSSGCDLVPRIGCAAPLAPEESTLVLRLKPTGEGSVKWRWRGDGSVASFGSPETVSAYALCLYDAGGGTQPVVDATAAVGGVCSSEPCWRALSAGFLYKAGKIHLEGLKKVVLSTIATGQILKVTGGGSALVPPSLPMTPPVVAQLQRSDSGDCWEATFGTTLFNDATGYKAKSD
jgi:DNA-binding beta-propeller fold protein YncE